MSNYCEWARQAIVQSLFHRVSGLQDVRSNVRLWGLQCKVDRHADLSAMEENVGKSALEISEIVLAERWDLKKRKELYRTVNGVEYDRDL